MGHSLLRSVMELRTPFTRLPAPYLLPFHPLTTTAAPPNSTTQTRTFKSTRPMVDAPSPSLLGDEPADLLSADRGAVLVPGHPNLQYRRTSPQYKAATRVQNPPKPGPRFGPPELPPAKPLHPSVEKLLPILAAQPSHYITIHVWDKPYLVTPGDQVRLPFMMQGVLPGDVLRLNRASILGSRDYTLKGTPYIDERLFECRATVLGSESEPMRIKIKKKQRNRRVTRVKSKHRYTLLTISELNIVVPEAMKEAGERAKLETSEAKEAVGRTKRETPEAERAVEGAKTEACGAKEPVVV